MLSEICRELKNWFDRDQPHFYGTFEIKNNHIADTEFESVIKPNQYFRIYGSVFNDGVWKNDESLQLTNEIFNGEISLMAIPAEVIDLETEIKNWLTTNADALNSVYASESFGGYSYSKASGNSGKPVSSWQDAFASKLNLWRKI